MRTNPLTNLEPVARVEATSAATRAINKQIARYGQLVFFQSGGCCAGSTPMCFQEGELRIGDKDVLLGLVGGCPFYIDDRQYEAWKHTQLILDVAPGEAEGFSLPAGDDEHFVIRSRILTPGEPVGSRSAKRCVPDELESTRKLWLTDRRSDRTVFTRPRSGTLPDHLQ